MKFWKIALSAFLAVTLFGCANQYQAPKNIHTAETALTKNQIREAILKSGTQGRPSLGTWTMKELNKSTIQASFIGSNGFEAVVDIPYSASGYEINYVSVSDNLKDEQGNIHRNYNRWVNNLDAKIKGYIFIQK